MACDNHLDFLYTSMTPSSFWRSVDILQKKPHVINKKLWGCKVLMKIVCKPLLQDWKLPSQCETIRDTNNLDDYKVKLLKKLNAEENEDNAYIEIILLELLPKVYNQKHAFQLVLLRKQMTSATFYDVTPETENQKICPDFTYSFQLDNEKVFLSSECKLSKSHQWLKETVLPQFVKWGEEWISISNESLALVCSEQYYQKYNDLKLKYGKDMVKVWPECTDPSKFVYEDVAIATYLLLLWEDERKYLNLTTLQTFVDLGCGNGLLVYILTKEGHRGVGVDVRKRQIWDMYSKEIILKEKTITPSDIHLFPQTDWLIGNHSDELTPWLPVIAARSSYNCNFFLLPCCAYNFDGTKYQRRNSSISQYTEYLQYIRQLCEDCGFKTDTDRLKIPSTKRICLIGRGRTYPKEEQDSYCNKIQKIISTGDNTSNINPQYESSWIKGFKARETTERVRNCTQIDKDVINMIVSKISNHLLEDCSPVSQWSIGKTVDISEVVQLIPEDKLKALKSECGGLQTLLRNNHHIFQVQNGKVKLRYPKTIDEVSGKISKSKIKKSNIKEIKVKQKSCWFFNNHPHGCPLSDAMCSFLHIKC